MRTATDAASAPRVGRALQRAHLHHLAVIAVAQAAVDRQLQP